MRSLLGKYRDLVFAIALFLVLDLGILMFNFYTSREIEREAGRINTAGELRMLTQQMTKSLLTMHLEVKTGVPIQTSMAQLSEAHGQFERGLARLSGGLGQDQAGAAYLAALAKEWRPLAQTIVPLIADVSRVPALDDVEIAMNKAVARNIKMALQTDDLASAIEAGALQKAARMRQIQVGGILLATLNFLFIIFKFLGRLRASDRAAEGARRETGEILDTVQEGLMLVRADGSVGGQASRSVARLLGRQTREGESFRALLQAIVAPQHANAAADYLDLLFDPDVKPTLIESLNPLHEVEVQAGASRRFLTFQFSPVREAGAVRELLVTIFDHTEKIRLERELQSARVQAKADLDDLLNVLQKDPGVVAGFLEATRGRLDAVNAAMQGVQPGTAAYRGLADAVTKAAHGIKGEAATLGIGSVAAQAHKLEDTLASARAGITVSGDSFIPAAVELNRLRECLDRVQGIVDRLRQYAAAPASGRGPLAPLVESLGDLARRLAKDLGKEIRFESDVEGVRDVPERVERALREAVPQLVRNAVAHGIEDLQARVRAGKSGHGLLRLEIARREDAITVSVRDDGRGIDVEDIRRHLVATGRRAAEQAATMNPGQLMAVIFEPDFSSADRVTEHSGRGVGLALVRDIVTRLGAKLRVSTTPRAYTQFTLHFKASA